MDGLQKYLEGKQNQKLVCIKYTNGKVDRVKIGKAHTLVKQGSAEYCPKEEWKKQRGVVKKAEPIEDKTEKKKTTKKGKNSKK